MSVVVWALAALAVLAARAVARAHGRRVTVRLDAERQDLREADAWFRKVREF
jgi:hypothetical protein